MFCDATYVKARNGGRLISRAVASAFGAAADGTREVLGVDIGDSQDETFSTEFLRSLRRRGLSSVQLVMSDATKAPKLLCVGCCRCRLATVPVHFNRNILARVGKADGEMVNAITCTIFAQPDPRGRSGPAALRRLPPAAMVPRCRRRAARRRGRPAGTSAPRSHPN